VYTVTCICTLVNMYIFTIVRTRVCYQTTIPCGVFEKK